MGRAIVRQPKAFLFDEPLSNLDAQLRSEMRTEIKKLHHRIGATTIYVTHDQVEAMTLAGRIVVLSGGRIMQVGTPDEIYNRPASVFVAGFTGSPPMNFVAARVVEADGAPAIALGEGGAPLAVPAVRRESVRAIAGRAIRFGVRPEDVRLEREGEADQAIAARVVVVEPLGAETLVTLACPGGELVARVPPQENLAPDQNVRAWVDMARFHLFDPDSGDALASR
jgi:multiple sugar transport system ATP-binding protein